MPFTRLLIQPGAGIGPIIEGIDQAVNTLHVVIFRFDRGEIEAALRRAVRRGVFVHALVAHTMAGQGGDKTLRKLEARLLADGVTVGRTATDLVRYHDKLMIVDGRTLFMLGFNYTFIDIDRSRCFGIITDRPDWVAESERLFAADTLRQQYTPGCDSFLVSPGNSRERLVPLLESARHQLLIYDGKLSDPDVMRLLSRKARAGVDVRVIGAIGRRAVGVQSRALNRRLHAQVVVRDGEEAFVGSQSLRSLELDQRREVGVILDDPEIIRQLMATFEADWLQIPASILAGAPGAAGSRQTEAEPADVESELARDVMKEVVKEAIVDAVIEKIHYNPRSAHLTEAVKDAAKEALRELVR